MTDLAALERDLLGQVEGAPDEAALEALRVVGAGQEGRRLGPPEDARRA